MKKTFPLSSFEGKLISAENLKFFSIDSHITFEDFQDFLDGRINLQIGHITSSGSHKLNIEIGKTERRLNITLSVAQLDLKFGDDCNGNFNILAYSDTLINIGDKVTSNGTKIVLDSGSRVKIGNDCMFSNGCEICAGDMHEIFDIEELASTNSSQSLIDIGEHVWIGRGAAIICSSKKISIGSGAIIGMNSVVTNNIDSMVLVAGYPSRVLKERVCWTRARHPSLMDKKSIVEELNKKI